ncbi:SDR family NAD(P)-dependent oxidoreductase [Campylobacter sp. faydin G-140]|uniref:SDR family NAD(P)-dependent oxidoreductase n=1 Tax=Campylobacter anatolicus TaxID=2829105 RepID=UPI001B921FC4|nr:SDR family NAD(P)-dependent oxidoreductase [Campylobacter anatolicus]MBR8465417.1 SDR family NAD(P)-dependent oxidoreductase [Campylobacter anatolicus]
MKEYIVTTGASSGIGMATARAFAMRGENLILIARRKELLESLRAEILKSMSDIDVVVKICDLSNIQNVYQVYDELKVYNLKTWINNAGFGDYSLVGEQNLDKIEHMIDLNIKALTIFSTLFVRDYIAKDGAQLINISSAGGYTIVPNAITYCASKFYVSAFTEGLYHELKQDKNAKMTAKLLAPAATKTEFGAVAIDAANVNDYDYDASFKNYHTSEQMAEFLLALYDSEFCVGAVDRNSFEFRLTQPKFEYARKY